MRKTHQWQVNVGRVELGADLFVQVSVAEEVLFGATLWNTVFYFNKLSGFNLYKVVLKLAFLTLINLISRYLTIIDALKSLKSVKNL
jgi:hypothetical protein